MKQLLLGLTLTLTTGTALAVDQICEADMNKNTPTARFIDNKNGTVTDRATKLTWMRCRIGQNFNSETSRCDDKPQVMHWQDALKRAESIRTNEKDKFYQYAGVTNWRLPNIKELNSIRERACMMPTLNTSIFPDILVKAESKTEGGYTYLWSSTPQSVDPGVMIMDITAGSLSSTYGQNDLERGFLLVADPKAK